MELKEIGYIKPSNEAIFMGLKHEIEEDPNAKEVAINEWHPNRFETWFSELNALIELKDGVKLSCNIGRAFRKTNLIDIRSEFLDFKERSFNKLLAEAYLYSSENRVRLEDMTATVLLAKRPSELYPCLQEMASFYPMKTVSEGLMHIKADNLLVQLAVCEDLSYEENLWLRAYAEKAPDIKACEAILLKALQYECTFEPYMNLFVLKPTVMEFLMYELDLSVADQRKIMGKAGYIHKDELAAKK
ncbi:MAG: hypothetical protein LBC41_04575 [Clostridiales bacterium]|jgi:hypothetical protein|nr:hypothetical protein [Clostridiales bacterium]